MKHVIINANSDLGVKVNGANLGPKKITETLNLDAINIDYENVVKSTDPKDLSKNENDLNEFNERLYNEIIKHDEFVITLGGDHSIVISSALASIKKHKDLGIIWIDAHPDYNTFETTITGNIHGLPLASINGFNGNRLTFFHKDNYINPENTVIVGARAIDPLEKENLEKNNIKYYKTDDIRTIGIINTMDQAFNKAGSNKKIHISFDIDVIDPTLAPGVSVPEINGLTFEETDIIFEYLFNHIEKIASIDIVEYNPLKDKNNITLIYVTEKLKKLIEIIR